MDGFFGLFFVLLINASFVTAGIAVVYEFVSVQYEWIDATQKQDAIVNGDYIIENNIITGIKVYENDVYVTVPRWRQGVPSTLNVLIPQNGGSPFLRPFPNWEMNRKGNCDALQYVQSMEIDPNTGYMWIIDTGRVNTRGSKLPAENLCSPKLVIFDIKTKGIIRSYNFPPEVVSPTSNFMNDIVLEYVDGVAGYAYITDTSDAKLYVYDFVNNESYFFQDETMRAQPLIPGLQDGLLSAPIDGIAMSPDFTYVYYCTLSAHQLYAVSTRVLHDRDSDFSDSLIFLGNKTGGSDGMAAGQRSLFYAGLEQKAVLRSDIMKNGTVSLASERVLVSDRESLNWSDTLAFNGTDLWFVANKLPAFATNQMVFTGNVSNIYIWTVNVGENGYLYRAMERTRNLRAPGIIG